MFMISVYRRVEGDLPLSPDAYLDVELEAAKVAACARLDGAQTREKEHLRPRRASIYLINEVGPNLLVSELVATEHGAVELQGPSN